MEQYASVQKVFDIAELAQMILLLVDDRTLLLGAQGVNKHFRDIVRNSSAIQRKLFFRPPTFSTALTQTTFNTLLQQSVPFCSCGAFFKVRDEKLEGCHAVDFFFAQDEHFEADGGCQMLTHASWRYMLAWPKGEFKICLNLTLGSHLEDGRLKAAAPMRAVVYRANEIAAELYEEEMRSASPGGDN